MQLHVHIQESMIKSLEGVIKKGFTMSDGPFVKGLDNALKTFNVHRQQYYGGIFVGNHILQVHIKVTLYSQL